MRRRDNGADFVLAGRKVDGRGNREGPAIAVAGADRRNRQRRQVVTGQLEPHFHRIERRRLVVHQFNQRGESRPIDDGRWIEERELVARRLGGDNQIRREEAGRQATQRGAGDVMDAAGLPIRGNRGEPNRVLARLHHH